VIKERKLTRQTLKENNEISTSDVNDIGIKKRQAFLDLLLDGNENENQLLSDDEIRHEVDTFMFAVSEKPRKKTFHPFSSPYTNPDPPFFDSVS
jgi:hypothetical protein